MTRRRDVVRAVVVAIVALGLSAQAAQARPFGLPPGGAAVHGKAPSQQGSTGRSLLAAKLKMNSDTATKLGAGPAVGLGLLAAQIKSRWESATQAIPPSLQAAVTSQHGPLGTNPGGVTWTAVVGGAAIIGLVGTLGAVMFRKRPHRPATA